MKKILLAAFLVCSVLYSLHAQWQQHGTQVSFNAERNERPFVAATGFGPFYVTWTSDDTSVADSYTLVRVNGFDETGAVLPGWVSGGVTLTDTGKFYAPQLVASEDSGVIVTWYGYARGENRSKLYAQKFSYAGQPLWNSGMPLVVSNTPDSNCQYPIIVSDKHNGAFIAWNTLDSTILPYTMDVRLQHINGAGEPASGWPTGGRAVAGTMGIRESYPRLAVTPDDSFIYVMHNIGSTQVSLWLNKFNVANGLPANGWSSSAMQLTAGPNVYPAINCRQFLFTDSSNNAIAFWEEDRHNVLNEELYMQRINASGTRQLGGNNGLYLVGNNYIPSGGGPTNGIFYVEVQRDVYDQNFLIAFGVVADVGPYDVGLLKVNANGQRLFFDSLFTHNQYSTYPTAVPDGHGGAFVFFCDDSTSGRPLRVTNVDEHGALLTDSSWTLPGQSFGTITNRSPQANYDFNATYSRLNEGIVAWNRRDPDTIVRIYVCNVLRSNETCMTNPHPVNPVDTSHIDTTHVDTTTAINGLLPGMEKLKVYPNPFENQLVVNFTSKANYNDLSFAIYNLQGQMVQQNSISPLAENKISTAQLPQGAYIYRITGNGLSICNGRLIKQ